MTANHGDKRRVRDVQLQAPPPKIRGTIVHRHRYRDPLDRLSGHYMRMRAQTGAAFKTKQHNVIQIMREKPHPSRGEPAESADTVRQREWCRPQTMDEMVSRYGASEEKEWLALPRRLWRGLEKGLVALEISIECSVRQYMMMDGKYGMNSESDRSTSDGA